MDAVFTFLSPTKRAVALNTWTQLLGRGISALTTLAVTVLIAREFGASGFGDFVKVTTYAAFFYLVADFGINAIFLQLDERTYFPALITLRAAGGVLLVAASLVIVAALPGSQAQGYTHMVRLGILLFSPTILLQGFVTTSNAIFQKKLRYDFATWAIFFGSAATIGLLWFVVDVAHATNLLMVIGVVGAGTFVTALVSLFFAFRLVGRIRFAPTGRELKRLLLPSIPLGITLLFNLVYFRADSVIITLTRPTAEVGVYGLAYKVFEVLLVFPTFFMNAVYPLLISGNTVAGPKLKKILVRSIGFLLGISLVALAVVWFAAPLVTLVKSDFAPSVPALRVLSLGLPFFFVTAATMWGLVAAKKQKQLAFIYGASMIVNIIGNSIFIPSYGFMAAAWMTIVGEAVVLVLSGGVLMSGKNI